MAHHAAAGHVVLVSGDSTWYADTWTYAPINPASYVPFGNGCAGTSGTPQLSSGVSPWSGESFTAELTSIPAASLAFLLLGASNTTWGSQSLPLSLAPVGGAGCNLLVSPDLVLPLANLGGAARWAVSVSPAMGLLGRVFHNQGGAVDPGANPLGIVLSNGATGVVGAK